MKDSVSFFFIKFIILLCLFTKTFGQNSTNLVLTNSLGFIENKGQFIDEKGNPNSAVKYLMESAGMNIQLRENGFAYDFIQKNYPEEFFQSKFQDWNKIENKLNFEYHRVEFNFVGYNPQFIVEVGQEQRAIRNYFREFGEFSQVKSYQKITYKSFYPNIDLVFHIDEKSQTFEYDFVVHSGGDVSQIQFTIDGADSNLKEKDAIKIDTRFGELNEVIPKSYKSSSENLTEIEVFYEKNSKNIYGFRTLHSIETSAEIIIDPVPIRLWGTYFGNQPDDLLINRIVAKNEKLYAVGGTDLAGVATSGVFQGSYGGNLDGAILQLSEDGQLDWFTYYGGSGMDVFYGVDFWNNELLVSGFLSTSNMATAGVHQPTKNNGYDGFITKFNLSGNRIWATYFGGERNDELYTIKANENGIFVAGGASSNNNISTAGSLQETKGSTNDYYDGYFAQFTQSGQRVWSSYFGGENTDSFQDLELQNDGSLVLLGNSSSSFNLAFGDAENSTPIDQNNGIMLKTSANGNGIWCTYLGGERLEFLYRIASDSQGNIFVAGDTFSSTNIAAEGSHQTEYLPEGETNIKAVFLQKYSTTGNMIWGTYFSGDNNDELEGLDINSSDQVFLSGSARSTFNIATPDGYLNQNAGSSDAFLAKFSNDGIQIWGTYYGGDFLDTGRGLAVEGNKIYLVGRAASEDVIATDGTYQTEITNGASAFFAKFTECLINAEIELDGELCQGNQITISASGGDSFQWFLNEDLISTSSQISVTVTQDNTEYNVIVSNGECSETLSIQIQANQNFPVPDQEELENIQAVCSITLIPPTATDECDGILIATTNSPTEYTEPGTYIIIWVFENSSGNTVEQTQTVVVIEGEALFYQEGTLTYCLDQNIDLWQAIDEMTNQTGFDIQFFENQEDMEANIPIANPENYINSQNLTQIIVVGTSGDCSNTSYINLELITVPEANNAEIEICDLDNNGYENVNLEDYVNEITSQENTIQFFEDEELNVELNDTNIIIAQSTVIYAQISNGNCTSQATITFNLNAIETVELPQIQICEETENSEQATFDLSNYQNQIANSEETDLQNVQFFTTWENAISHQNQVDLAFQNQTNPQIIFALDISKECPVIYLIELLATSTPDFHPTDYYTLCPGNTLILTSAEGFDSYLWSTGETTESIEITEPGIYQITVNLNNCSVSREIEVVLSDEIFYSEGNLNYCLGSYIDLTQALSEMTESSVDFQFFETENDLNNNNFIADPVNYNNINNIVTIWILANFDNCSDASIIHLTENPLPEANNVVDTFCDMNQDGFETINLSSYEQQITQSGNSISFYSDSDFQNLISENEININETTIIYAISDNGMCQNESILTLQFNEIEHIVASDISACSNSEQSEFAEFNLMEHQVYIANLENTDSNQIQFYANTTDALNQQNALSLIYTNISNPQTIYAVNITESCPSIYQFNLMVNNDLDFNPQTQYTACFGESVIIDLGDEFDSYFWSTGENTSSIVVNQTGEYEITVSRGNCSANAIINVEISDEMVFDTNIVENDLMVYNIHGNSPFQFQLNRGEWQSAPNFYDLEEGDYVLYVKDAANCVSSFSFSIFTEFYNFISPNNDGLNDFISFKSHLNGYKLEIYNRYGKLLFTQNFENSSINWNGFYNGKALPTGTYYYLIYNLSNKTRMGYISLKNR